MEKNWSSLIKPKRIEVDEKTHTSLYGEFTCQPLEKGFGITLGNALRRVLLSSIYGAAITSVKIEGVLHEFSALTGVKEDVSDIILNMKGVRLKLYEDGPRTLHIDVSGEGIVTAGDIITDETVEILNADHHLATLSDNAIFNARTGRQCREEGMYPQNERQIRFRLRVLSILMPCSPLSRRLHIQLRNARVGQITDYDKLILEVWTDGSISARRSRRLCGQDLKGTDECVYQLR